jgi:prepilin-type processing-associated H-X9-DG protein
MTGLTEQQKELLFDYCFGFTSESENSQAQELIFSNDEAARFAASIKASLSPLDIVADEECPEELAEGTIWRAQQAVRTGRLQLSELIAAEQRRKTSYWRELFGQLATAAVFIIVGGLFFGGIHGLNYARQRYYWPHQCGARLAGLFQSLSNYREDNNGQMPAVAAAPGAPWWKVGDQGPENVSNTRRMWLLVRYKYAQPTDFMCPAKKSDYTLPCEPEKYNDFPERKFVLYSFRIGCPKSALAESGRRVIISDLNPVFENLPSLSDNKPLVINLTEALLRQNSPNHKGWGQNVLFCDGSVKFIRARFVDVSKDDIFTLEGTRTYQGVELPASEEDAFLAP